MGEFFNFVLPMFSTSRNYGEVLSKLAGFALLEVYILTFILRRIPEVETGLSSLEAFFPISAIPNSGGVFIAVGAALLSRYLPIHNKISHFLGIRHRFDLNNILVPLAQKVAFQPTEQQRVSMEKDRIDLMYEVFYKYASSRDENPIAGKHNVEHAMDAWSGFWWMVEATVFLSIAALCAGVFLHFNIMLAFFGGAILCVVFAMLKYPELRRKTKPQINAIAGDITARQEIQEHLNAL